jgi:autotransporter-associated beta strand protein
LTNAISGAYGDLWQFGPGTLTLSGPGTYTGRTFVYGGGTLILNSGNLAYYTTVLDGTLGGTGMLSGPVTVNAGTTLAPGASAGSVGTLTINNSLTNGGNLAIEVNKSLAQSNDLVVVSGVLINAGTGTLTVANLGPALAAGDKFTLFSKPMQNGAAMAVTGAGATWANNLAVDGSISVTAVTVPTLNFTKAGNNLQFSWDTSFGNYKLQSQTNSLNSGISTNWSDYSGGGSSPVTVPINSLNETVFFRLVSP